MLELYVDADACPVKEEVYRVARRCALKVHVVSNSPMSTPPDALVQLVLVGAGDEASHVEQTDGVAVGLGPIERDASCPAAGAGDFFWIRPNLRRASVR